MALYEIPLSSGNQKFNINLGKGLYKLSLIYRIDAWYISILDTAENVLISSLLLAGGINLIEQYQHIAKGALFVVNENIDESQGYFDLGSKIRLYYEDAL